MPPSNTFHLRASIRSPESIDNYFKRLAEIGIKRIGRGQYASVFQHPTQPDLVVKVGEANWSKSKEWLLWCKKNPSRWTPKVTLVEDVSFQLPNGGKLDVKRCFIAFLEKLQPADGALVKDFLSNLKSLGAMESSYTLVGGKSGYRIRREALKSAGSLTEDLRRTLLTVSRLSPNGFDCKVSNFRSRGSQLVLTDPVI